MDHPSLFPDLEPVSVPDRFEGLGRDARQTARQADLIAAGYNPGTRLVLHAEAAKGRTGAGLRCRDCRHLYRTGAGNSDFLKCEEAGQRNSRGSWGPDMRGWWPACRLFEAPAPPAPRFEWTPETWGVYVDECRINGIGRGGDLWAETWMRMAGLGRTVQLDRLVPPGGIWHVAFGDGKDDSEFAREYMIDKGIPPNCLVVMTLRDARKSVRRKHRGAKYYGPEHSCRFCDEGVRGCP